MNGSDGTERLQRALSELVIALCRNDAAMIEAATAQLQSLLAEVTLPSQGADDESWLRMRSLLEAAQCLVWARLLLSAQQGAEVNNFLVGERV